ncbi:Hypothetical_protein [Hexamita inflata]|uniref:Hypothetical_protein n=1 Tax=Hexamita inflata TaxID=28002 RepID=A0ABP1HK41_9EUKA
MRTEYLNSIKHISEINRNKEIQQFNVIIDILQAGREFYKAFVNKEPNAANSLVGLFKLIFNQTETEISQISPHVLNIFDRSVFQKEHFGVDARMQLLKAYEKVRKENIELKRMMNNSQIASDNERYIEVENRVLIQMSQLGDVLNQIDAHSESFIQSIYQNVRELNIDRQYSQMFQSVWGILMPDRVNIPDDADREIIRCFTEHRDGYQQQKKLARSIEEKFKKLEQDRQNYLQQMQQMEAQQQNSMIQNSQLQKQVIQLKQELSKVTELYNNLEVQMKQANQKLQTVIEQKMMTEAELAEITKLLNQNDDATNGIIKENMELKQLRQQLSLQLDQTKQELLMSDSQLQQKNKLYSQLNLDYIDCKSQLQQLQHQNHLSESRLTQKAKIEDMLTQQNNDLIKKVNAFESQIFQKTGQIRLLNSELSIVKAELGVQEKAEQVEQSIIKEE